MVKIYVIVWKYYDNSAAGLIEAHKSKIIAERELKVFKEIADGAGKEFSIQEVNLR